MTLPRILTIGNFDGFHLGHQKLISEARALGGHLTLLTFENHPFCFLHPEKAQPLLFSPKQKIATLKTAPIDNLILLPFTKALASLTAAAFLKTLPPFTHLVLGEKATFGVDRLNPENLLALCHALGIHLTFVPLLDEKGIPISSSRIRHHILKNELDEAEKLLGRSYSLQLSIQSYDPPHLLLNSENLCLPPGSHAVELHVDNQIISSIATSRGSFLCVTLSSLSSICLPSQVTVLF